MIHREIASFDCIENEMVLWTWTVNKQGHNWFCQYENIAWNKKILTKMSTRSTSWNLFTRNKKKKKEKIENKYVSIDSERHGQSKSEQKCVRTKFYLWILFVDEYFFTLLAISI